MLCSSLFMLHSAISLARAYADKSTGCVLYMHEKELIHQQAFTNVL